MADTASVIVATDLSADARAAAEWAARYAADEQARVVVVHVVELSPAHWATGAWGFLDEARLREQAEGNVRAWYVDATGSEPAAVQVLAGTPAVQLRQVVEDLAARLLVIARSGKRGWERFWLGSTAKALALDPPCELVIAHPAEGRARVRDIVVGTDFSAGAGRALDHACIVARHYGARLHIVHAEEVHRVDALDALADGTLPSEYRRSDLEIEAARALEKLVAEHADALEGIDYETRLARGDPADALIEQVERNGSDLLVMGRTGHSPLLANVVGSAFNRLVQVAPTTLLVLPAD